MYNQQIGRYGIAECLTLSAADIAGASDYLPLVSTSIPTGQFPKPVIQWFLQNWTDQPIWFSVDGSTDHIPLPSGGFFVSDIKTNLSDAPTNMIMWAKTFDSDPATGAVYLTIFYSVGG
jgi:hypothetical protein